MRRFLIVFSCLLGIAVVASAKRPVNAIWDIKTLEEIRKGAYPDASQRYNKMLSEAERVLHADCISVVDKETCKSGNIHNYESISVYHWPDPTGADKPYICRDGETNPEYQKCDARRLSTFRNNLKTLVQAYYVSGDKSFAEGACKALDVWFLDEKTYMEPNFNYGQVVQGRRQGRGYPGSISEAFYFCDVIEAVVLLHSSKGISSKQYKKIRKWFNVFSEWLVSSELGQEMKNQTDNTGIMYDVLLYRICSFSGDKKTCKNIVKNFDQDRLAKHIASDGSQPLELQRTKAMYYSVYNILHIMELCLMAENDNYNLYKMHRETIKKSIDYVGRYIDDKASFPYKEIGDWGQCRSLFTDVKAIQSRLGN